MKEVWQQRDDVFTDAAPIVRTSAGSFPDASRAERDGDSIRLILGAFAFGSQLQALSQRFDNRVAPGTTLAGFKTLRAGESAILRFR